MTTTSPLLPRIGAIFVAVSDIERARDWYCHLLGIPADGEIMFGHIYCIPLQSGLTLVLDSKIFPKRIVDDAPMFHFNTQDIEASYAFLKENGIEVVGPIQHGHWFNFRDPDGNLIMASKC
ncbi:VOC family protein [Brevibacillus sp. 179-C9.3 HS]|uniref:VOC family protein n=1 Tax=unclassified Brevibacillus TaxID=2684853 RepID=UPI0039A3ECE6